MRRKPKVLIEQRPIQSSTGYDGDWFTAPRPPRWFVKALVSIVVAVFVAVFIWRAMGSVTGLFVNLVIAFFLALAMEPLILWLVRHKWKRGAATGVVLFGLIVTAGVVFSVFGRMFFDQATQLVQSLPEVYDGVEKWIESSTDFEVPGYNELQSNLINNWGDTAANQALAIGASLVSMLFNTSVVLLVAYYLAAAGPKFRASICAWLSPSYQSEVLNLWEITQTKISDYLNSRLVLAAISSVATGIFLTVLGVPYALPLAVFTGVVSQFVPTIGTYIGGALPIVFALTNGSVTDAVAIAVFIVAYQQIENFWLSPKISARALELNPAVAFIVVLGFGAIFGALGAFLALPVAATIQAIGSTYLRRHELIDSTMLRDPEPDPEPDPEQQPDQQSVQQADQTGG